jgi:hypothetical protein
MVILDASQKALEIPLVPACSFMLCPLEFGVLHVRTAVLAPVFGL